MQTESLYDNLIKLSEEHDEFKFKDIHHNGATYRIFSYGIAVEEWQWRLPGAQEARGITFRIDDKSYRIVSRPLEKFFNLNENGLTDNIDLSKARYVSYKEDGSMVSTFIDANGELALKTKLTLDSFHTNEAMKVLKKNTSLYNQVYDLTHYDGCTVILEWVGPTNRIVLSYTQDDLKVLAIRYNESGGYIDPIDLSYEYDIVKQHWVKTFANPYESNLDVLDDLAEKEDMEGYVFIMPDWQKVKVKTEWYRRHHGVLTNLIHPKSLFELFLAGELDDIKPIVSADRDRLDYVLSMEKSLKDVYNDLEKKIDDVYNTHKHLSQKSFAIRVLETEDKMIATACLAKYNNKPISIENIMRKNVRRWIDSNGNWVGSDTG